MAVIKNPHNLRPDIVKNRARNLIDGVMRQDKAAIAALHSEGFRDAHNEVGRLRAAYFDPKSPDHSEAIEKMRGLYEIVNDESE